MQRIVVILSSLNNSWLIKRVIALEKIKAPITVYGFERNTKSPNRIPENIPVHKIGDIVNGGNYLKRMFVLYKSLKKVFKQNLPQSVYYVSTFDLAIFCCLYRKRFIYEVSDIVYTSFPRMAREIFRHIDQILVRRSLFTLMTSEGFKIYLFGNKLIDKIYYTPNRLSNYFKKEERGIHIFENGKIRFSFIGLIRYPNTVFRFAKVVGKYFPEYEFHFYGICDVNYERDLNELVEMYKNVYYHGPFKNPDDLKAIYAHTDVTICCYDTTNINERIAEPNKLYESIFFTSPIVVTQNTFLSQRVMLLKCGYSINPFSDNSIKEFIETLTIEELKEVSNNMFHIDKDELIDNTEDVMRERLYSLNLDN